MSIRLYMFFTPQCDVNIKLCMFLYGKYEYKTRILQKLYVINRSATE